MEKSIHLVRYAVFLKTLKEARERAGLTQVQLAKRLGETQMFVSKCERGERRIDGTADVLSGFRADSETIRRNPGEGDCEGGMTPYVIASHSWQLITSSLCS